MPQASKIQHPLIIPPQFDYLILSPGNKMLAFLCNSQRINLPLIGPFKHPNRLPIKRGPISDFPIRPSCQQLTLLRMIKNLFKQSRFK